MFKIIFNMIIITIIIIFALFNQDDMVLNFFNMYEIILPKFFVVTSTFVAGFLMAVMAFSIKLFSLKMRLKNLANKYKSAQLKLNNAGLNQVTAKQQFLRIFKFNGR
ncbi:MAG: DUF1049 domain-containing protein [Rickettsiales bacterium]|jgi:uncharacterized integral membrane protein|nr:DUF1049 domain-containing protein [Rickettsiales bacterium]